MKQILLLILLGSCHSYTEYSPYGHPQTQNEYRNWVSGNRYNFLRMQEHRQFQQQQPIPHRSDTELYQSYTEYQSFNRKRSQRGLAKQLIQRQQRFAHFISHRSAFQKRLNQKKQPSQTRMRAVDQLMTQQYKHQKVLNSK